MRKLLLTALFVTAAFGVFAQNKKAPEKKTTKTAKTPVKGKWSYGGNVSVALSQGGTRNWAPGGDRFTLAGNGFLNVYANHAKKKGHWDNMLEANYGMMNSASQGIIKNDDKLDLNTRWSREISKNKKFRLGAHGNFRTQFVDGFDFDGPVKKRISAFLAPGIGTISAGGEFYSKDNVVNIHFGPAIRWVLVANRPYELAKNYDVLPNREVRIEAGTFASINVKKEIIKNVTYRGRLDIFSDMVQRDPGNMDIFLTNMIYLKVNKYLSVVYNLDLQYDDNVKIFGYEKNKPGTQLKSIFGVGMSINL